MMVRLKTIEAISNTPNWEFREDRLYFKDQYWYAKFAFIHFGEIHKTLNEINVDGYICLGSRKITIHPDLIEEIIP